MEIIKKAKVMKTAGKPPKKIEEFIGMENNGIKEISIARMKSLSGWSEPGQTPDFDEYITVIKGFLRVKTKTKTADIKAGQSVIMTKDTWVQYSTPKGAEYFSVCLPAFTMNSVHRNEK
ncbi:MAG: cupin [Candidatus Goldiibacteriota bacterium HGW-Goldbacteria-1]|jgi:ethanolamine utilization protein EutQ (cupin superfamily)|nr:MAG: cupin [Candidatus Goldiibacteriota bacterium HGW-Goldbacteria-1]